MSRVAFTCLLKQKLKFCSSLTHIFDEKKVSIFFKNKPVWRIFSPGFMFSEMNLWKFRHYFWQFRHYFWKLDFSSTLMLKLMETLFFKLLCRTPELPLALPLVTRHAIYLASISPVSRHYIALVFVASVQGVMACGWATVTSLLQHTSQPKVSQMMKERRAEQAPEETHIFYTILPPRAGRHILRPLIHKGGGEKV